jgi:hypothetical protein
MPEAWAVMWICSSRPVQPIWFAPIFPPVSGYHNGDTAVLASILAGIGGESALRYHTETFAAKAPS